MVTTGKILRFDEVRGYGFIAPHEGGEDVFMHANDLRDEKYLFQPGTTVEFQIEDSGRGLKASEVTIVDRAPSAAVRRETASREDDDGLCDVLSTSEFRQELTETLLESVPSLTAAQIIQLRQRLIELARAHNWLES
ncbi:putative cold-shock DNA-binding protein [Amycolatopsis cihanbeyliensis]|uniref:Putative cold-shock DNA-binding protein n=1 Tax=Amycolatopsis cihanbeyliensis TaxID=1128664 RepID=A0A542DGN6_AMYCI|nr:putative cold-shock DNA-binding protein [Amycolatopsis cihanbeyliensis]